uniref:Uncharacterized protein n=1 Tax=Physcomitrium patens TaxID=3218 RepID=A0A2K1IVU7_PHYPA|nr:hypothetical protein PHYPA_025345 [Physcomitrium patens]
MWPELLLHPHLLMLNSIFCRETVHKARIYIFFYYKIYILDVIYFRVMRDFFYNKPKNIMLFCGLEDVYMIILIMFIIFL